MLTASKNDARVWYCASYLHVPNQPAELRAEKPVVAVLAGG